MRSPEESNSQRQKVDGGSQGLGGGGNGECLLGTRLGKMKRALEMDGGDGCTTI